MLHKNIPLGDIHYIHNWEVADAAALAALTPTAADKGKLAWQQDTDVFYFLVDHVGPVWKAALGITGATGPTGATGATGPGVPTGGATGTILYKVSATDFNSSWSTLADAGIAALLNPVFACASGVGVKINNTGTGNSLVIEDSTSPDSTYFAVSADGNVSVGAAPDLGFNGIPEKIEIVGTGAQDSSIAMYSFSNTSSCGNRQYRTRVNAGTGAKEVPVSSDSIGNNSFFGWNGSAWALVGAIQYFATGTYASGYTPSRVVISTNKDNGNGTSSSVNAICINSGGRVTINGTTDNGADTFQVNGSFSTDAAAFNGKATFNKPAVGTVTALTSTAASMAINLALANNFSHTTTENTTLAAPSNPVAGQSGVIVITQGATPRLLAYNTFWKFPGGTIPTLTASASAVDVLAYYIESATRATCQLIKDVK